MVRARDVYCDICSKFIRNERRPSEESPFNLESPGPHFCSHQCAKSYYDNLEGKGKDRRKK